MNGIRKRVYFYLCVLLCVICLGLFLTEHTKERVSAEESATFQMADGVAYRNCWSESHCGLTYSATLNKAYYDNFVSSNAVTHDVSVNLLVVPYSYVTSLAQTTVSKYATAKASILSGDYVKAFDEATTAGASFWYGVIDHIYDLGNMATDGTVQLRGGLKTIQVENMNRRYFGVYYLEGKKADETVVRSYAKSGNDTSTAVEKAARTANSFAYVVSSLDTENRNEWETANMTTFLKRSVEGALKASVDSTTFNNAVLSDDFADTFGITMGTLASTVTATNVDGIAGNITYGDDTFYHNFYAKYTENNQEKIVDVTSKLDFNAFWTINGTDCLKQNTANKKDVEVIAIGTNKQATVKVGFATKTVTFNTLKLDADVEMALEGNNLVIDRVGEFYSSSPTAMPTKATVTLKANGTTRLTDKTYEYTFESATAATENGYNVVNYGISGYSDSTLKAKIPTSDYSTKLDITSATFNRSGEATNLATALNVECNLYNFTATDDDYSVKLNRYTIAVDTSYTDLSGEGDVVNANKSTNDISSYYFADEPVNLNSGASDDVQLQADGYTFNGFVKDTAFTSDFLSASNISTNYMLARGSYNVDYVQFNADNPNRTDSTHGFYFRNNAVITKKVKAGTVINFSSFKNSSLDVMYWVTTSSNIAKTLDLNGYVKDSGLLYPNANVSGFKTTSTDSGSLTLDGNLYQQSNGTATTTVKHFDYFYVTINVMYGTGGVVANTTSVTNATLIAGVLPNITLDGLYQQSVNTGDTDIDAQSLVGAHYFAQGSFGDMTNINRMRMVITRRVKKGTVISWNANTISSFAGRTYQFGFIESTTPTHVGETTYYSDSNWKSGSSGSYTVTGKTYLNGNTSNTSRQDDYVYLIINASLSALTTNNNYCGFDVNEPATVFNLLKFKGWFEATDSATSGLSFSMPAENVKLQGVLKANYYTVQFDYNGGSGSDVTKSIRYGTKFVADVTPTKSNYIFCGWTVDTALAKDACFEETLNAGTANSTKKEFSSINSSTMICNNQWTGQVTFKSLCKNAGTVILRAQWASNKSTDPNVASGYLNGTSGLNLNGTQLREWGVDPAKAAVNNISNATQLAANLYGNFTKTVKIYQEACTWSDAATNSSNALWNTAILGFYRFVEAGSNMTAYYASSGKSGTGYWNCTSVLRQDGVYIQGDIMIGSSITKSSVSNASFFDGTMAGLVNSNYNAFYEVCRRSYVTFTIQGFNVGSYNGRVEVTISIQGANTSNTTYAGTTYSFKYTIAGLDKFPVDLILYGDRVDFVVMSDTLTRNSANNTLLTYSSTSGGTNNEVFHNFSHYVPNVTLSTDLSTSEAYVIEFKQTMIGASSTYDWSGDCWRTPLVVLYDARSWGPSTGTDNNGNPIYPDKYAFVRQDWISFKSGTFNCLKALDVTASTKFVTNQTYLNRLKSSTVRITIQKSHSFIHIKWQIGIGSGESNGYYEQDMYYYYVSTDNGKAIGTNCNTHGASEVAPISIMIAAESSSMEITKAIYPITPTDDIYYDTLKNGGDGWLDLNQDKVSYVSDTNGAATCAAGNTYRYYMYIESKDDAVNWHTPLPIVYYGTLIKRNLGIDGDTTNQNLRIFRFDNFTFGAGQHAHLSGTNSHFELSYTYDTSPNYGMSNGVYNAITANLLQHGMCIMDLNISADGTVVSFTRYISDSYKTVAWWSLDASNTDGVRIQYTCTVWSSVANSSLKLGLAMTCEESRYNIIRGIKTTY